MPYSSRTQEQLLEEITVLKDRIRETESLVSESQTVRDRDQMFRSFLDNPAIASDVLFKHCHKKSHNKRTSHYESYFI